MNDAHGWKRAFLWSFPILAWLGWFAHFAHDVHRQHHAIASTVNEPEGHLSACLDYASDTTTGASLAESQDECRAQFAKDKSEQDASNRDSVRHIVYDQVAMGFAALLVVPYFLFVPKRWRAGVRTWIFVIVGGVVLVGVGMLLLAMAMPIGD